MLPNMLQACVFVAVLAAGDCFLPNLMNQPLKFAVSLLDESEGRNDLASKTTTVTAPATTVTDPTVTDTFRTQSQTFTVPTITTENTRRTHSGRPTVHVQKKQQSLASSVHLIQSKFKGGKRPTVKAVRAYGGPTSEDVIIVHKSYKRGGSRLPTVKPVISGHQTSSRSFSNRSRQTDVINVVAKPKKSGGKVSGQQGKLKSVKAVMNQSGSPSSDEIHIITDSDENDDNMLGYVILKNVRGRPFHQQRTKSYGGSQHRVQARPAKSCIFCA